MHSILNEDTIFSAIKQFISSNKKRNTKGSGGYMKGSIARYAKNLIMTFPVLCDASITPETAMMVSRANERNVADMLQMLFSSMNINSDLGDGETGADILAKFYNGIDPNMDINELIDALDFVAGNSGNTAPGVRFEEAEFIKEMMEQLKHQTTFKKESLNERSLEDYVVKQGYNKVIVSEVSTKADKTRNRNNKYTKKDKGNKLPDKDTVARYRAMDQNDDARDRLHNDQINQIKTMLTANDVKKVNDLQPLLLAINFNVVDTNRKRIEAKETFLAGIKSRVIPVESSDIIDHFSSKNRTKLSLKNFIRATTGEIKFFKDFLFCLDQAKIDGRIAAKKGPMGNVWHILEKRAAKNNLNKARQKGNDASAITTVVLSQESVNLMKNSYMFDLEDPVNAKMILDSFNLLALFICDEATETAKIIYDGNAEFEMMAYSSLERNTNEKEYRKAINIMNSMGR